MVWDERITKGVCSWPDGVLPVWNNCEGRAADVFGVSREVCEGVEGGSSDEYGSEGEGECAVVREGVPEAREAGEVLLRGVWVGEERDAP